MQNINFEALSTKWSILIDFSGIKLNKKATLQITNTTNEIKKLCNNFENNYSRFKTTSLLSKYNKATNISNLKKPTFSSTHINDKQTQEFTQLIKFGKKLEKISDGFFSCNAGKYLGRLGYGKNTQTSTQNLDFGAYGKGWLIDDVASFLLNKNYKFFIINAGGDVFATQKSNGEAWNVALEHPTKKDIVVGTIKIKNKALAGSSPFKRTWTTNNTTNNHLINGRTGLSIKNNRSVFTLSKNAKIADGLATTLNIIPKNKIKNIAKSFSTEYLIIKNNTVIKSKNFNCVIFE